jgi:HD-like signal output (HDOD) protein
MTKRVLFVDDDTSVLEALERILFLDPEWEAATASTGEEALRMLESEQFDVIVSDMRMPGMDGATLLTHVFDRHPQVMRVVLTGQTEVEAAMRAIVVAHQFLSKPCSAASLFEVLALACRTRDHWSNIRLREAVGRVKQLPSAPGVYLELIQILGNPNHKQDDLIEVINRDVAISAKLLQISNSAFIGARQKTTSLKKAVSYIGTQMLRSLVLSCELQTMFERSPGDEPRDSTNSLKLAAIARTIAREIEPEAIATAALIHDAGCLILRQSFSEEWAAIKARAQVLNKPRHEVEREILGFTDAELGGYLLAIWGIPSIIVDAVTHQYDPLFAKPGVLTPSLALNVALLLTDEICGTSSFSENVRLARLDKLRQNGFSEKLDIWRAEAKRAAESFEGTNA